MIKNKFLNEISGLYKFALRSKANKIFLLFLVLFAMSSTFCFFSRYTENKFSFFVPFVLSLAILIALCFFAMNLSFEIKDKKKEKKKHKRKNKVNSSQKKSNQKPVHLQKNEESYYFDNQRIESIYAKEDWSNASGELSEKTKNWLDRL